MLCKNTPAVRQNRESDTHERLRIILGKQDKEPPTELSPPLHAVASKQGQPLVQDALNTHDVDLPTKKIEKKNDVDDNDEKNTTRYTKKRTDSHKNSETKTETKTTKNSTFEKDTTLLLFFNGTHRREK